MATTYRNVELGEWGLADMTIGDYQIELVFKIYMEAHENVKPPWHEGFTKEGFIDKWQDKISAQWDDKFTLAPMDSLRSARSVIFRLRQVTSLDAAHMPVYILNGDYAAMGGLVFPTRGYFGGDKMFVRLNPGDNRTYAEGKATAISQGSVSAFRDMFNTEIERVKAAVRNVLNGNGAMEITLDRGGSQTAWTIQDTSKNKLNLLCEALAASPPYYPQPVVKLNVSSGIAQKGQAIASAVTTYMTTRGVNLPTLINNVVTTSKKFHAPFSGHKATASATLEIQDAGAMYRNVRAGQAMADYCVSAHEFGHMFGLPDEYLDYTSYSNEKMKRSQPAWDRLCDEHDPPVPKRNWRSQFNESVMSIGTHVYKAHAIPVWDAVQRSTRAQWRILEPA